MENKEGIQLRLDSDILTSFSLDYMDGKLTSPEYQDFRRTIILEENPYEIIGCLHWRPAKIMIGKDKLGDAQWCKVVKLQVNCDAMISRCTGPKLFKIYR